MSMTGLTLALALTAFSQTAAQEPQPDTVDDVEVVGHRLRDLVEDFVDDVSPPPLSKGIPRWRHKICVGVANLHPDAAQAMVDRISAIALEIGLEPGDPGCSPNILIMATNDGQGLARALVQGRRNTFRPNYGGAARSARQLQRFQDREDAVRWWHVSMPVLADTGLPAVKMPGEDARPMGNRGGLLTTDIRNDLRRAFVIIDMRKVEGLSLVQLSDYVAMTALARIDPDTSLDAYPTVLNVMTDPTAAAGLTDWDRAYLVSLYGQELNQRQASGQAGAVAAAMIRRTEAARSARNDNDQP